MKKSIISLLACALLMSLAACSTSDPVFETTVSYSTYNLIVPLDQTQKPYAESCQFSFVIESYASTLQAATDGVTVNNVKYPFETSTLQMTGNAGYAFSFATPYIYETNFRIQSLKGVVTQYINNGYGLASTPTVNGFLDSTVACLIQYEINDVAIVKTFQREAYYKGTTNTTFDDDSASSDDIVYRIVMDITTGKATVVVYNAQFAPAMPKLNFILRDLDIAYTRDGFTISGSDVVPEGTDKTLYPNFPFNDFTLTATGDDLSGADIDFTVAGRFHGQFSGSFIAQTN